MSCCGHLTNLQRLIFIKCVIKLLFFCTFANQGFRGSAPNKQEVDIRQSPLVSGWLSRCDACQELSRIFTAKDTSILILSLRVKLTRTITYPTAKNTAIPERRFLPPAFSAYSCTAPNPADLLPCPAQVQFSVLPQSANQSVHAPVHSRPSDAV